MTIAESKRKTNIVEFLLHSWQMEDLLRSIKFKLDDLEGVLSSQFEGEQLEEERKWFLELNRKMKSERLEESGHTSENTEILIELVYLHGSLLSVFKDQKFIEADEGAKEYIEEFKSKSTKSIGNDVEVCLVALYGLLSLRLKGAEVSSDTMLAMKKFQRLLAILADRYRKMKDGTLQVKLN
jgi:hypothetical protein